MKYLPHLAGGLLGLLFVAFSLMFLLGFVPEQSPPPEAPPEGAPGTLWMGVFVSTGYITLVKVLELVGGILVAIPKTRNFGLLILGPIIINILAFHQLVAGDGIFQPVLIVISLLALYLLWAGRRAFLGLLGT